MVSDRLGQPACSGPEAFQDAADQDVRDSADSLSSQDHAVGGASARSSSGSGTIVGSMRRSSSSMECYGERPRRCRRSRRNGREDWLEDLQRHYKANFWPGVCQLRLTKLCHGLKVSADTLLPRQDLKPYLALSFSPANNESLWLKKIVVTPALNNIKVVTPAMEFGWLRVQLQVGFDWRTQKWNTAYRIKTKWTKGSKIAHRFQHLGDDHMTCTSHWTLKQDLPQLGGQLDSDGTAKMKNDLGRFELDFTRLKASIRL